jgi:flagellar protein FliJ
MTRSERLGVVQQATSHTEREHAERVALAERHVVEMEEKLSALEKYRKEYESGFTERAGAGLGVAAIRDYQAFLARLGDALEQQRQAVELARAAHQAAILLWREAAKRAHVVDTLAERWQVEESRAEERRDQRDSDELSQQQRYRNRDGKS